MHNGKTEDITNPYHTEFHISQTNPPPQQQPPRVLCRRHCWFASLYQHPPPLCDAMYSGRNLLMVWRNTLPPNSGYKRKIVLPVSLICFGSDPSSSYYHLMFRLQSLAMPILSVPVSVSLHITLEMKSTDSSKTAVHFYHTSLNHMPKYSTHHSHCYQNLTISLQQSIKRRCTHTQ